MGSGMVEEEVESGANVHRVMGRFMPIPVPISLHLPVLRPPPLTPPIYLSLTQRGWVASVTLLQTRSLACTCQTWLASLPKALCVPGALLCCNTPCTLRPFGPVYRHRFKASQEPALLVFSHPADPAPYQYYEPFSGTSTTSVPQYPPKPYSPGSTAPYF